LSSFPIMVDPQLHRGEALPFHISTSVPGFRRTTLRQSGHRQIQVRLVCVVMVIIYKMSRFITSCNEN